ncbi:hypothetical protein H2202_000118 [Exophiala xenobiotica]|nr:hypothetical protein H2202_000118 [Exophiala xenobiotica]KAK5208217.1 hypothetical protein LTR41_006153 [Exophiala xenobiotica]KAK5236834.1 hypothetical protein LTR47_002012 [Exophiala xenobiotica]KAK5250872.1 hypothetical protein LTS06_004391 [Exophiala xenobiotica]KAK5356394.1 hypothetical protein LTR61_000129 [Exophiala xenobiotica]
MSDDLEERLKSHARAFDSLLSLIPAKLYYGEDVSDQWQRKKQTPEQKKAAKMAKLDPDNWKSAKDVMDERAAAAKKRKRGEEETEEDGADPADPATDASLLEQPGMERPKASLDSQTPKAKKQRTDEKTPKSAQVSTEETEEDKKRRRVEQRAEKRARKNELKAKAKEKKERQKSRKTDTVPSQSDASKPSEINLKEPIELKQDQPSVPERDGEDPVSTASSDEEQLPEVFSPQHESGTSSTSSIQPPNIEETTSTRTQPSVETTETKPSKPASQNTSQTPRERLQAAIQQLRAERKADGADGRQPPKNRQELLEQRRQKEEERKAAKKEQRRREKEEEARRQDEEIARRFSPGGSGSLLASPRSPISNPGGSSNNFSFGRIAFEDGTQFDPTTGEAVSAEQHKKKGPRDTASQLQIAMAKKNRLSGLDEEKRKTIEEKDMWLNAKKRAHGEHVKDDTSLLKKALKRQQGQKKKSDREWTDRLEGVQKSQEAKQKKRTENLAKRKDEKHSKGGSGKKVKRPGFEGSFKGRTGGKKK